MGSWALEGGFCGGSFIRRVDITKLNQTGKHGQASVKPLYYVSHLVQVKAIVGDINCTYVIPNFMSF